MDALTITSARAITPAGDLPPALFEDFIRYIDRGKQTTRTYIINLRQFAAYLAYKEISRPQRQDVIEYRDYLGAEHDAIQYDPATGWTYRTDGSGRRYTITCKPNTVKIYLQSVRQFFSWTAANGYYPNIAANIHTPKTRQDVHKKDALAPGDVLIIEKAIEATAAGRIEAAGANKKDTAGRTQRATEQGARLLALYTLAVNAGLRTVELSRANCRDLEVKNGRAVLYIWGKGHSEPDQKKPLAPEVYDVLRQYLDIRTDRPTPNSPLFVSTGNRSGGQRIAETTISKMLKEAMQGAGYDSERLTAHSLRHTCGTAVQEITGNLYNTQTYMRHESPVTTEIYLHCDTEKQEAQTAQELYNLYHGIKETDDRARLETILNRLTPAQLAQVTGIAAAIAG